jgi:hypothetical protein
VALVLDRHGVEHRAVAARGRMLSHGPAKLAGEADNIEASHGATMRSFKVGGDGKSVKVRRGPATVIGDAGRIEATGDVESPGRRGR